MKLTLSAEEWDLAVRAARDVANRPGVLALRFGMEALGMLAPVTEAELVAISDGRPTPTWPESAAEHNPHAAHRHVSAAELAAATAPPVDAPPGFDADRTAEVAEIDPAVVDPRLTARIGDDSGGHCPICHLTYPAEHLGMPGRLCPVCGTATTGMIEIAEGRFAPVGSPEAGSPGLCRVPIGGASCVLAANHDGRHDPRSQDPA